jgi:hypothetical protein
MRQHQHAISWCRLQLNPATPSETRHFATRGPQRAWQPQQAPSTKSARVVRTSPRAMCQPRRDWEVAKARMRPTGPGAWGGTSHMPVFIFVLVPPGASAVQGMYPVPRDLRFRQKNVSAAGPPAPPVAPRSWVVGTLVRSAERLPSTTRNWPFWLQGTPGA